MSQSIQICVIEPSTIGSVYVEIPQLALMIAQTNSTKLTINGVIQILLHPCCYLNIPI